MDFPGLFAQLLNGVQYGLLLFLIASGLTLIFGVLGVINLAHGSLFMIGAYLAFLVVRQWGSVWLALPVAIVVGIALGAALERGLFRYFYAREHLDQVLLTFALILLFEEGRSLLVGNDFYSVPVPALFDFSVPITAGFSYSAYRFRAHQDGCRDPGVGREAGDGRRARYRRAARAHDGVRRRHRFGADRGRVGRPALLCLSQHG
jgi:branched-chain amino acid transport system permease protein